MIEKLVQLLVSRLQRWLSDREKARAEAILGGVRGSCWWRARKAHIKEYPNCACCGTDTDLDVHHIRDFSTYPEDECNPNNLMTLCRRCHKLIGHCDDWKSINLEARVDAAYLLEKIQNRR